LNVQKKQKEYYSKKKYHHHLKTQVLVDKKTNKIIRTAFTREHNHDFNLFKKSKLRLNPKIQLLGDLGYVGMDKYHKNNLLPHKKKKGKKLSIEQKKENKELGKVRITVEHTFAKMKRFKIFYYPYRNRRKRFALRFNLFAAIHNMQN